MQLIQFWPNKKIDSAFAKITISYCCCIQFQFFCSTLICHSSYARHNTEVYKWTHTIKCVFIAQAPQPTVNTTNPVPIYTHLLSSFHSVCVVYVECPQLIGCRVRVLVLVLFSFSLSIFLSCSRAFMFNRLCFISFQQMAVVAAFRSRCEWTLFILCYDISFTTHSCLLRLISFYFFSMYFSFNLLAPIFLVDNYQILILYVYENDAFSISFLCDFFHPS